MRNLLLSLTTACFLLGASGAQGAAVPFTGSLSISVASLPPIAVPGGGLMTLSAPPSDFPVTLASFPAGVFATTLSVPLPNAFPIVQLKVQVSNPAAVLSLSASPFGTPHPLVACSDDAVLHGRAGLTGTAFVGILGTSGAPFANLTVPLGLVGAGSTAFSSSPLGITLRLSGAGWTSGTVSVISPGGGTFTAMGGQTLAELESGSGEEHQIRLVSPLQVYTNATGGYLPSFVRWTVRFQLETPEPGVALLLATGALGLGLAGRRHHLRR